VKGCSTYKEEILRKSALDFTPPQKDLKMSIVDDIRPMPGPGSAFVSRPAKFKGGAQAQAPTMTHEQPKDMVEDDAQLERLMTTVRCIRCTALYREDENNDEACAYHPGPTQTGLRNQNHLDRVQFLCCGAVQIGYQPILLAAEPCKVGRHISQEEKKKQLEEKKAQRAAMQNDDPNARGRTRR